MLVSVCCLFALCALFLFEHRRYIQLYAFLRNKNCIWKKCSKLIHTCTPKHLNKLIKSNAHIFTDRTTYFFFAININLHSKIWKLTFFCFYFLTENWILVLNTQCKWRRKNFMVWTNVTVDAYNRTIVLSTWLNFYCVAFFSLLIIYLYINIYTFYRLIHCWFIKTIFFFSCRYIYSISFLRFCATLKFKKINKYASAIQMYTVKTICIIN